MATENGYEITSKNPGWIKRRISEKHKQMFTDLMLFYVFNTPCESSSASAISLSEYGWNKSIWKTDILRNALLNVACLESGKNIIVAHKLNEMKDACTKAQLKKGFQNKKESERIAIYRANRPIMMSVFYHIRNAFAHGRVAIYDSNTSNGDAILVLEDGIPQGENFQVRSRMVLKSSTLYSWMNILKRGNI